MPSRHIIYSKKFIKNSFLIASTVLAFYASTEFVQAEEQNAPQTNQNSPRSLNEQDSLKADKEKETEELLSAEEESEAVIAEIKELLSEEDFNNLELENKTLEELITLRDDALAETDGELEANEQNDLNEEDKEQDLAIEESSVVEAESQDDYQKLQEAAKDFNLDPFFAITEENVLPAAENEEESEAVEKADEQPAEQESVIETENKADAGEKNQGRSRSARPKIQVRSASLDRPLFIDVSDILTNNQFFNNISQHAVNIAARYNLYPSVMMAQAALESGWGQSRLASSPNHNLFGIKGSYKGQTVSMPTSEYTANGWIRLPQNFKKYPSYAESFEDNAKVLRNGPSWNSSYYSGAWRENASSYRQATQFLTGRYATDPNYNTKLNRIIEQHGLQRFDNAVYDRKAMASEMTPTDRRYGLQAPPEDMEYYTVRRGDTLSKISRTFNTSVAQLKDWNDLDSDLILIGQSLRVKEVRPAQSPADLSQRQDNQKEDKKRREVATHRVVKGDTLSSIARTYGTTVQELKAWNGLESDLILVDQELNVVKAKSTPEIKDHQKAVKKENKAEQRPAGNVHKVQAGDTLYQLALTYGTSVQALKELNHLQSDVIIVGQNIAVGPVKQAGQAPTSSSQQANKTEAANKQASTHLVQSGDTLSKIARQYGTTVANLKAANNLRSDLIIVGQRLKVAESSQPSSVPVQSSAKTYRVQAGDSLYQIAQKYGTSINRLVELNQLKSADLIIVGQVLRIR